MWQIWLHCHGLSTQNTSYRNSSDPPQNTQKSPCQIKPKASPWRQRQVKSIHITILITESIPSSSHHSSHRGYSRSQHWDRCSNYKSRSWWSHSTHRGHSHRPHHGTPHHSHCRSSTHRSSSGYQSRDHSRSSFTTILQVFNAWIMSINVNNPAGQGKNHTWRRKWGWRLKIHTFII